MSWHLYIYCGKFLMVTLGRSERLDQNVLWTVLCLALDPSLWNCLLQTHWAKLVLRTASPVPKQTTFTLWSFCPLKQHLPWVTSKTQYRSQSCGLWGWQKCSCSCWIWLANPSSAGLVADARGSWFLYPLPAPSPSCILLCTGLLKAHAAVEAFCWHQMQPQEGSENWLTTHALPSAGSGVILAGVQGWRKKTFQVGLGREGTGAAFPPPPPPHASAFWFQARQAWSFFPFMWIT